MEKIWINDNGISRLATPQEIEEMKKEQEYFNSPQFLIPQLIQNLNDTDYQCNKWKEGWLTDEEYEPIRMQRQAWRDEINRLEKEMEKSGGEIK